MLYPFDVSGWKWGPAWLTTATMLERIRWQDFLFIPRGKNGAPAKSLLDQLVKEQVGKTSKETIAMLLDVFDVNLPPAKEDVLIKELDGLGGPAKAFANSNQASASMRKISKILFASPEAQLC